MLNIFVIFTFFGNLILGIFVYLKDKRNKLNRSFALISFSVALWIISAYMFWVSNDALFWGKMMFVGPITLGIAFPYFMRVFPPRNSTLKIHYKVLFLFPFVLLIALTPTNFFVKEIIYPSREVIYGMGNAVFGVYFMTYMGYAFFMLIKKRLNATGINRDQLNYLLIGTLVTTIAGSITNLLLPLLGTSQFNRLGPSSTIVFIVATAYAIVKYRLMDIRVIVSNITIFIGVYTLVLGIPIYLYILGYKLISLITMGILATLGPVIYSILRKQAEDKIFEEQRQYQTTLRNASLGMAQIKDLNHLVRLIVHIVLRAVRIENCKIFLFHEDSSKYILKASKGRKETTEVVDSIKSNHELTEQLKKIEGPLVFEEIKQRAVDFNDSSLKTVEQIMIQLGADVIIPSFIEKKLIAFLVLGKKVSGQLYSQDDLSVFSILANQAALAIENAMFYEQTQKTTEQLFRAEKMATIGTMADGLSHQINNRLHAVGFVAGDALDSLKLFIKKKTDLDPDTKQLAEELLYSLDRIQDNVKRGGEIVGGLLRYTRKGAEGMSPVDLNELISASMEMAQFKIKVNQFDLVRNFNGQIPKIKGNFTQLQEVLFNVIDNAYDAMMQRKSDLSEVGYKARLEISAEPIDGKIQIVFRDNGMGVKTDDIQKIFTPFFTTKATSKKGTGLGMYVIRQIIEENHGGKVFFRSKYKEGSEITMTLPVF